MPMKSSGFILRIRRNVSLVPITLPPPEPKHHRAERGSSNNVSTKRPDAARKGKEFNKRSSRLSAANLHHATARNSQSVKVVLGV